MHHLEAWRRNMKTATNTMGKIRSTEAEGGCNGPITNGKKKITAATTNIATIEPMPQPNSSILIKTSCSVPHKTLNIRAVNVNKISKMGCVKMCGGVTCRFRQSLGVWIYIYKNSLHGVAWQGVTTVGLVCIYAKFFEIVPTWRFGQSFTFELRLYHMGQIC